MGIPSSRASLDRGAHQRGKRGRWAWAGLATIGLDLRHVGHTDPGAIMLSTPVLQVGPSPLGSHFLDERRARLTESSAKPMRNWRYGMHPRAKGSQIRSMGRVELPLGEALRVEMVSADPGGEGTVHLQYYIVTDAGPWALWLTCAQDEIAAQEAAIQEMTPPLAGEA